MGGGSYTAHCWVAEGEGVTEVLGVQLQFEVSLLDTRKAEHLPSTSWTLASTSRTAYIPMGGQAPWPGRQAVQPADTKEHAMASPSPDMQAQLSYQMGRSAALAECFSEALPPRERLGELKEGLLQLRTTTEQLESRQRTLEDTSCGMREGLRERLGAIER